MKDVLSDDEFIARFEDCTLPGASFHHASHVKLAWLYLNRLTLLEAIARFSEGLKRFATANGKPDRYHETITWAFLFLIHQRLSDRKANDSWEIFAAANPDLVNWEENILRRYYQEETLQSEQAKKCFLLPDRLGQQ
jgi:hypothetical protein